MEIKTLYDPSTHTLTYVVYDPKTKDAVIIDPVLDYDPASGKTSTESLEKVVQFVKEKSATIHFILETHAHADHLSGAHEMVTQHFPSAKIAIGERICEVQETFKNIFNFPVDFKTDGSQFHRLLRDGEEVSAGSLKFKVIFTPGHTPACASYLFDDAVFTGDALFMPDSGTGRCDFPKGDARVLYHSIVKKLYTLPDTTRVFVGHDYQPNGRTLAFETTIGVEKSSNVQLKETTTESDFLAFRTRRDVNLAAPRLLLPSVQVNIAAGELPPPESNGLSYLKIPITKARPK
jgi:glyoxylase-like metal-dependent hydrolase (beta-lactamase superfamily II)